MINVALVGGGHIHTPGFVKRLRKHATMSPLPRCDQHRFFAEKNAELLSARRRRSQRGVWTDESILAVVICFETDRHADLVSPQDAASTCS
ncbi:MAG: hypothetical protein R2856_15225 [Caldilineaceae bacterium]